MALALLLGVAAWSSACESSPDAAAPEPADQPAMPAWTATAPQLSVSAGEALLVGHGFRYAMSMAATSMDALSKAAPSTAAASAVDLPLGRLQVLLRSASRGAECTLARATWTGATLEGEGVVPAACAALAGADDLVAETQFEPMAAADGRVAAVAVAPASTTCLGGADAGCLPLRLAPSPGVDVQLDGLRLGSSVAVLEFAGAPMPSAKASPAVGAPGEQGYVPEKAAVDPALYAPTLVDAPILAGQATLWKAGGVDSVGDSVGDASGWAADDLALTLAIRPAGSADDAWMPVQHAAVATGAADGAAAAATAAAAARPLPVPAGAERLGVAWSMRIPPAVRQRMIDGDLQQVALWQVRVCAATAAPEAGLAVDAKANNCQVGEFALVRLERPYGVHRYPEASGAEASGAEASGAEVAGARDLPSTDYFEIGKTETQGSSLLRVDRFRGGYREVADGHVRFGGVFWTQAVSSLFSLSSGKLTTIRAYHDTAPVAKDFVSGSIDLMGFATIALPKFDVPDSFQFALNAAVDTSASTMKFDGSASLDPLVSALNFIGKQASSGGPKFCIPLPGALPDLCLEAPLIGSLDLVVGVAFAKGVDQPSCQVVAGGGCLEVDADKAGHFWSNAKSCIDRGAMLPSNRAQVATVKALRAFANAFGAPFYLAGQRPGIDYNYLMSQVFFDKGWQAYASEFATALPTYWAFLDASLLIETGACAAQAPDIYTKAMRVDYGAESVAKASIANPAVLEFASNAHVPCHAQLQRVCEYPTAADGTLLFERNEVYAQLAVQAGVSAKVEKSVSFGVPGVGSASGNLSLHASLLSTTFAATVGQRWTAAMRKDGHWETQGSAFGTVGAWGKLGDITITGEACGTLVLFSACFPVTLGGLTKILPITEVGLYFSMDFLPFHVKAGS